jgi:hypothetical protein
MPGMPFTVQETLAMTRMKRALWSLVALASCVLAVLVLTSLGSRMQGPFAAVMSRIGIGVSETEIRLLRPFRGPGRSSQLAWFQSKRVDVAWLRHPPQILLGAYDDRIPATFDGVLELEQALKTTLPLIQIYTAWGDRPDEQFPRRILQAIWELGSVPVVTWEPWLVDFQNQLHPNIPLVEDRDRGGMAAIAGGDYDFYIDAWAGEAADFKEPLFLRFGHEMNDPYRYPWGPQNNKAGDYVAAWRHVVDRFRAAGASNVLWVWSPHLAYEGAEWFYPGDDYVDWVATGVLNYGNVAHWSKWWTFEEIFGQKQAALTRYRKPIMIAEFGSLVTGGDRIAWFEEALTDLPDRYPLVRALLFFNVHSDRTVTLQSLDWSFVRDLETSTRLAQEIGAWSSGAIER